MVSNDITGYVLAGGNSSRIGSDKGLILIDNKPMFLFVVEKLAKFCNKVYISANNKKYEEYGFPTIPDVYHNIGPIGGIYSCLLSSETEYNVFLPCDMPFIDEKIIQTLLKHKHEAQIIMPSYKGYNEPLILVLHKSIERIIKENIKREEFKVDAMLTKAKHIILRLEDFHTPSELKTIININTTKDLKEFMIEI